MLRFASGSSELAVAPGGYGTQVDRDNFLALDRAFRIVQRVSGLPSLRPVWAVPACLDTGACTGRELAERRARAADAAVSGFARNRTGSTGSLDLPTMGGKEFAPDTVELRLAAIPGKPAADCPFLVEITDPALPPFNGQPGEATRFVVAPPADVIVGPDARFLVITTAKAVTGHPYALREEAPGRLVSLDIAAAARPLAVSPAGRIEVLHLMHSLRPIPALEALLPGRGGIEAGELLAGQAGASCRLTLRPAD